MADNQPTTPGGAVPPKPGEAAKVQPKKETVRITLPPKPTAGPTVKLPSLHGAGSPGAPTVALPTAAPSASSPTVALPSATSASMSSPTVALPTATSPATPAPAPRTTSVPAPRPALSAAPTAAPASAQTHKPAPMPVVAAAAPAKVSPFDTVLAIAAVLVGILVVVRVWMLTQIPS